MDNLKQKAKELLENKTVDLVIGYEKGSGNHVRPAFIMDAAKADSLIYSNDCVHNLAVYLTKHETHKFKKIAVFASLPVLKSIVVLANEHQLDESKLLIIGITNDDKLNEFANFKAIEEYIIANPIEFKPEDKALIEKIDQMTLEEKWNYWQEQLSKCFKCYACRSACPLCYCSRCTVENNQPQWIPVAPHDLGNFEWHIMRAMHLAGRCISCGQCGEACPLGLPIHILTLKVSEDIMKEFGFKAGHSISDEYVLSTFKPNDHENFIR